MGSRATGVFSSSFSADRTNIVNRAPGRINMARQVTMLKTTSTSSAARFFVAMGAGSITWIGTRTSQESTRQSSDFSISKGSHCWILTARNSRRRCTSRTRCQVSLEVRVSVPVGANRRRRDFVSCKEQCWVRMSLDVIHAQPSVATERSFVLAEPFVGACCAVAEI